MHSYLISLLIAGILACPYQCAAKAASALMRGENAAKLSCCGKCQHGSSQHGNDPSSRLPNGQDCDDVGCWCDGVVLDHSARHVVDDAIHTPGDLAVVGECFLVVLPRLDWATLDVPPHWFDSGADVRVHYQTFLL